MRWAWAVVFLLAGCSKGPDADLQYIKQARSLAAEWALINDLAAQGQLTGIYVQSMHQWLREQLAAASSSVSEQGSAYGAEMRALMQQPDDAAPDELRRHADNLKRIEDRLESA